MKPSKAKVQKRALRRAHVSLANAYQQACFAVDRLVAEGNALVAALDDPRRPGSRFEREVRRWDVSVEAAALATRERW